MEQKDREQEDIEQEDIVQEVMEEGPGTTRTGKQGAG